ncbi:MAG: MMPL family transporter, partial [Pseudomonas sp.]
GALTLLLLAFRRLRVLLAFLPVLCGLLAGVTACVALFGQVHVITLVLGGSLIGVASDYPLHYLAKSWTLRPWTSWSALRATLPGLSLSLATNLIGYLALACTPFPALTQIAAFSVAGLLSAYLCAVCLLPALLKGLELRPWPALLNLAERIWNLRLALLRWVGSPLLLGGLLLFCAGGLYQLTLTNDLRQWVGSPPQLLDEAKRIARITGYQPTSQFFLVRAANQQQLLERQARLGQRLDRLIAQRQLHGYSALSQLLAPSAEQAQLRQALGALPQHWQPLLDLGVPAAALERELKQLQTLPELDIPAALAGPLGEPWRPLWLGADGAGVAGLVSLHGLSDAGLLAEQAQGLEGVQWVDRLGQLNRAFAAAQWSAAELKLLSCGLIAALLVLPFGLQGALRVVALPLLAALASLASLGWLGQPLTLFSLFGLLLVSAIGVDYAILMRERVGGAAVSLLGNGLAALTTWLSFGLLALSHTPAVSNFGLAVGLGLVFSFLLAPWAGEREAAPALKAEAAL